MTDSKNTQAPKKFKILLIGDSCKDEYFIGTCDRISPEAPVPILKIEENFTTPGMAANVQKNFQALNQNVEFITNQSIIKKIRYIDKRSGQHLLRVDDEPKTKPWSGILSSQVKKNFDAVVISDYNKGFLTYQHIESIISKFSCPIFIDTKKRDLARFEGAFIKINLFEFNQLTSTPNDLKGLIVTNGENGAMYDSIHYPAQKVEVSDVCGAGDTFLAYLVYGYLDTRHNMNEAIKLAIRAASKTVTHRGNYAPTLTQVLENA